MKSSSYLLVALASLTSVSAFSLQQRSSTHALELPIQRRAYDTSLPPHVRDQVRKQKRQTLSLNLDNELTLYLINGSLGTPAQNFRLHIDTGSSDLWVNTPSSALCKKYAQACDQTGVYIANSSSTYKYVNSDFNITYVDGSGAIGDYATDTFALGNVVLDSFQFGIGYSSDSAEGILGIGYAANEVALQYNGDQPYANLPVALTNAMDIDVNAYSLYLNDLDASTGSILFGGVDNAKYSGSLYSIPILPTDGTYAEFVIGLTGIGQNGKDGSFASNLAVPVLLDSGSSLTYLPDNYAQSIFTAYNAQYNEQQGAATVSCNLQTSTDTIDYSFSDATISVALSEIVLVGSVNRGVPSCILGIAPAGNSVSVLGDTFLRSAYVVYDLQGNTISLAQTDFNSTGSNIMDITKSGVPGATAVSHPVTSAAVGGSTHGRLGSGNTITISGSNAMRTAPPTIAYGAAALAGAGVMWAL